ncbi:MAG: ABC transporter permease [Myxococcota bacterium]
MSGEPSLEVVSPVRAAPVRWPIGLGAGAFALLLDVVFVRTLGFASTRAAAVGVSLATLSLIMAGGVVGVLGRRFDPRARARGFRPGVPWGSVLLGAAVVALASAAALLLPSVAELCCGQEAPEFRHAVLLTNALFLPALALSGIGAALGTYAEKKTPLGAVVGFLILVLVQVGGAALVNSYADDPNLADALIAACTLGAFFVAGALVPLLVRRLGFVELCLIALGFGYTLFLLVGRFGERILKASSIPEQQVLVVLSVVPTAIALALLSVGASVGFLLLGGGKLDAGFGFEWVTALRYLRLEFKQRTVVVFTVIVLAVVIITRNTFLAGLFLVVFGLLRVISRRAAASTMLENKNVFLSAKLFFSTAGVSLGVTALIVVLSVMGGFEDDVKTKLLGAHAHIAITKKGDDFSEYAELTKKLARVDGVRLAEAFLLAEGMISSEGGPAGTLVKGIDVEDKAAVAELEKNIERGRLDDLLHPERIPGARKKIRLDDGSQTSTQAEVRPEDLLAPVVHAEPPARVLPGIVIGRELARSLHVYVGDVVNLVSPASEEIGPNGPAPKLRRFRVAAIFYAGMYEFDSKFTYVDLKQAQRFFGMHGRVTGIELRVHDVGETPTIVEEVKRVVGGYPFQVRDWREMNKELFSALLLEKLAMFIVLTFIVLVASFLIASTLVMIVLEKGREIAILKAMGATDGSIMKIFVIQGLIIGFVGAGLGLICGVSLCLLIQKFGNLDPDMFYITQVPVVMDPREIAVVVTSALTITYLASIYPAMAAAELSPVEGLRND